MLKLVEPCKEYLSAVVDFLPETENDNAKEYMVNSVKNILKYIPQNFDEYLQLMYNEKNGINLKEGYVAQTTFWLIDDNKFIGTFALRHNLAPSLLQRGGHIAYYIRPSERQKGYAFEGLKLCLEEARKLGIEKTLITCNHKNIASYKTMHKMMIEMGGNEVSPTQIGDITERRVWIYTDKRHNGKMRVLAIAVIKKDNKVLAIKGYDEKKDEYFYRLPGGGIEFGEKAEQTLHREFMEELGLKIIIKKQLGVSENIFEFNGKKGHEIVIAFEATLENEQMQKQQFPMIEQEFEGKYAEFVEITPDKHIYPTGIL